MISQVLLNCLLHYMCFRTSNCRLRLSRARDDSINFFMSSSPPLVSRLQCCDCYQLNFLLLISANRNVLVFLKIHFFKLVPIWFKISLTSNNFICKKYFLTTNGAYIIYSVLCLIVVNRNFGHTWRTG